MRDLVARWSGTALCAIGVIATLVLAITGRLTLYIHPRYATFTVVMAFVGGILVVAAVWLAPRPSADRPHHHHDHHGEEGPASGRRVWRFGTIANGALVAVAVIALLIVPPSSLSAERAIVATGPATGAAGSERPTLVGSDSTVFTVKDWASLLGQGLSASDFAAQRADVTGFILDAGDRSSGVVYVARYMITCCAVDAQVTAIPVSTDGLSQDLSPGDWVRVTGSFADFRDGQPVTRLVVDEVEPVDEPSDPYVF